MGTVGGVTTAITGAIAAQHSALAAGNKLTPFFSVEDRGSTDAGKCTWRLVTLQGVTAEKRAAVAWLIADAIMRTRCGKSTAYSEWREAALAATKVTGRVRDKLVAITRSAFGTPEVPGSLDHVEGHVAEWLWYLLMHERNDSHRSIALLEPPKFLVTEPGPDGFVVYDLSGQLHIFRLWELKKHTGKNDITGTVRGAYGQLRTEGSRYLAQLTAMHSDKEGSVGELCAQLVDLWIDGDNRAGAAVGLTSAKVPPPKKCFTTMGKQLPVFQQPGQLEGMLCAVEEYRNLALDVRGFLWSVL